VNRAVDAIQRRIGEAQKHLESLDVGVQRFVSEPVPYTKRVELDARGGRVILRAVDVKPVPPEFGILIGECVYQLRAALDNLVYALAEKRLAPAPVSEDIAESVGYPISESSRKFRSAARSKLTVIDSSATAVIERLQPYHRRKEPRAFALRQLQELRNVDQHRLLHPVALARDVSRHIVSVGPPGAVRPTGEYTLMHRPLKENAMLAHFGVAIDPAVSKIDVYVEDDDAIDVVFERRSPAVAVQGQPVVSTLNEITEYVSGVVVPMLLPFLA
jgi:hypothetical protein